MFRITLSINFLIDRSRHMEINS